MIVKNIKTFLYKSYKKAGQVLWEMSKPGGDSVISKILDERAIKRTRQAFIVKTNDVVDVKWLGKQCYQYPIDAWLFQEVLSEHKPDLVIETGTWLGGSAFYTATLFDFLGHGEVISIDIDRKGIIEHERITYIEGSSTSPEVLDQVKEIIERKSYKNILVMLDSDHRKEHVLEELNAYSGIVNIGGYIHVQDGNMDDLQMLKNSAQPGPMVAAAQFLDGNTSFVRDIELEKKYLMTEHPYGWLKKVS